MAVAHDSGIVREKIDAYVARLKQEGIPIWRIYFFGSHARGTAHEDSDIDLAVFLDKDDIEGFREEVELMHLTWDIDLLIEPHAFARTDFDESDPFIKEIIDTGVRVV